jgi:hypothetical protein
MKRERRVERGKEGEEDGVREEEERTEKYVESKTTNKKLKTKGLKNEYVLVDDSEQEDMT